jgi:hypothetical protein
VVSLMGAGAACAQGPLAEETNRPSLAATLRIRSEPSGAFVALDGEHTWKGSTPWDLSRGLKGTYHITAEMSGYERWRRTVHLVEGESRQLDIRLSRKSAVKAALRSVVVPGWGQFYAERPTKGTVFLVGAAAAATGLLVMHELYENDVDELNEAQRAYQAAGTVEEIERLRPRFEEKRREADRSYDRRQILLYTTGAVCAASVLDALFLFPSPAEGAFASMAPWGVRGPSFAFRTMPEGGLAVSVDWIGREVQHP